MNTKERRTERTMCPMNCHPTLCGMMVTVEGDRLVEIKGDKDNPDSEGFLCVRGQASSEIINNPARLLHPMVRDQRGTDNWRQVSWDEALDRIINSMRSAGREAVALMLGHGAVTNDFGTFANAQLAVRLANMYGCQWWDRPMVCWGLGGFGLGLTGTLEVNTKEDMSVNADFILLWGTNPVSQPNTERHIAIAKKRGAQVIAIDVRVSEACRSVHDYFLIKPGTDAALALAMMHVIIDEGLEDAEFISSHTIGFDALRTHVQEFPPQWASEITGIDTERIAGLARQYASVDRAMILLGGSSMYKHRTGWQSSRAVSCLPPLTGKMGKSGAGFGPRHAAAAHGSGFQTIVNVESRLAGNYIPNQMSAIIDAIANSDIRVMLLFGTNILSSWPDAERIERGLGKMDLIVHHDLFMNETARRYADIVLPAAAWLEYIGCKGTPTHLYLTDRILEPAGEARSLVDLVKTLAQRLGVEDFYVWEDETGHIDAVLDHPGMNHMTVASLRANGGRAERNVSHVAYPKHRYATPSGKIEFYSDRAGQHGLPTLPSYQPRPTSEYPLEIRMGRIITQFHSFFDHGRALPSLAKRDKGPLLWISPSDATARGIEDGDSIKIYNNRGECSAKAKVTDRVPSGTTWIQNGCQGLNNVTESGPCLPDSVVDIMGFTTGQSAYDAHVEVCKEDQSLG